VSIRRCLLITIVLFSSAPLRQPAAGRAAEIDMRPLTLRIENAFPQIAWEGWQPVDESGVAAALRPILVTYAAGRSGQVFVPTQQGVIYSLPNRRDAKAAQVFLDIRDKVSYDDKTNEEGFLGLAFHPKFADNGLLYAFYTNRHEPHQNVVSRFRASPTDPNRADPSSEKILMTFDKPKWNHDGGTLVFGPDGDLYIFVGEGGLNGDPTISAQDLKIFQGKMLRIDVDHTAGEQAYSIPRDNPFVGQAGAHGEIWAYGLRNVWRMAFDRATGSLWAADVGDKSWEEINLITRGGNYGWALREGSQPFGPQGSGPREDLIEPIFQYDHNVGKSITGGMVYRGTKIPELVGGYLYADFVSGKMWALFYDAAARKVTANREIPLSRSIPIMSFGEDAEGEAYFTVASPTGEGVFGIFAP
jgi:glucose/arabinose dehydrogenase